MQVRRPTRLQVIAGFAAVTAVALLVTDAVSQRRGGRGPGRFAEMERRALAEDFVGVATAGRIERGLFSLGPSGVPTTGVRQAAKAFLQALSPEQRDEALFPVDDPEWRRWANQHSYPRRGVSFEDLDEEQRKAAFSLLRAGLSAKGFRRSRDIMRLNHSLGEITSNFEEFGEWLYYVTVMGEPSATQPWGWQLDGHHLIVNYFVLGDQVVMTPTFMGSEPVLAEAGKYSGVSVMQAEQQAGLDLIAALDASQREAAVISRSKTGNNALAEAFKDNLDLDFAGLPADQMDSAQRSLLLQVVEEFVSNMDDGHAKVKMEEVRAHLDRTHFAWIGETEGPDSVFYYRVHSPVVLIEFDHQRPVFMPLPRVPQRQHIHSVMRTPNGNDYGKDLLRQHYESSHRAEVSL